jgi:hypothetical protein
MPRPMTPTAVAGDVVIDFLLVAVAIRFSLNIC